MESLLKRFLICCAFFGVYTKDTLRFIGNENSSAELQCRSPFLKILMDGYLVALSAAMLVTCGFGLFSIDFADGYLLSWIVATMVYLSQVASFFIITLESRFKHEAHQNFLSKISEIGDMLRIRLKQKIHTSQMKRELRMTLYSVNVITLVCIALFATGVTILQDVGYFWHGLFPTLIMRMRMSQIVLYVQILLWKLKALNAKLRQIVEVKVNRHEQLLDIDYDKLEDMERLNVVREIYGAIFDAFNQINGFAGWSLLTVITCYFLDFTCNIYWALLAFDGFLPRLYCLSVLSTVIPLGMTSCYLCYICEDSKYQGQRTAFYLNKLITQLEFASDHEERCYKNLIHDFSLQLQLQPIAITAKGVYDFDKKLIMSIFASVASHLVILIQFLRSDKTTKNIFVEKSLK